MENHNFYSKKLGIKYVAHAHNFNNMNTELETTEFDALVNKGFNADSITKASNEEWKTVWSNTFPQYNIWTKQLWKNGKPRKDICMVQDLDNNGSWIVSQQYRVTPHPYLQEVVGRVGDELGVTFDMVKGTSRIGRYYKTNPYGAMISKDGRFMCASFIPQQNAGIDITGDGDRIQAGLTVINTMDSSSAIISTPFTYRLTCTNQLPHLQHTIKNFKNMSSHLATIIKAKAKEFWERTPRLQLRFPLIEDYLDVLIRGRIIHNQQLDEQVMADQFAIKLEFANAYLNDYSDMEKTPMTLENIQPIVDGMQTSVNKELDVISVERKKVDGEKQNVIEFIEGKGTSQYDLLNNYTDILTHDPDISRTLPAQLGKYQKVHELFNFGNRKTENPIIAQ